MSHIIYKCFPCTRQNSLKFVSLVYAVFLVNLGQLNHRDLKEQTDTHSHNNLYLLLQQFFFNSVALIHPICPKLLLLGSYTRFLCTLIFSPVIMSTYVLYPLHC